MYYVCNMLVLCIKKTSVCKPGWRKEAYGSTLLKYTAQQKLSTDFNIMPHFDRT